MTKPTPLRKIPSVSEIMIHLEKETWARQYSRPRLIAAVRFEIAEIRQDLKQHKTGEFPHLEQFIIRIKSRMEMNVALSLRKVINASGIIVHTNLGRAPLPLDAISHV